MDLEEAHQAPKKLQVSGGQGETRGRRWRGRTTTVVPGGSGMWDWVSKWGPRLCKGREGGRKKAKSW